MTSTLEPGDLDTPEQAEKRANRSRKAIRKEEHAERLRIVLETRRAGWTYQEIGQRIGVSPQRVYQIYTKGILAHTREASEEERETTILRCEGIIRRFWPDMIQREDPTLAESASRQVFRAMNLEVDLWGIKRTEVAELKVGLGVQIMPTDAEVWSLVERLRERGLGNDQVIDTTALPAGNGSQPNGSEP
jgi:Homeodomain-like domain